MYKSVKDNTAVGTNIPHMFQMFAYKEGSKKSSKESCM